MMRICMIGNATAVHTQRWATAYREAGHAVAVVSIRSAVIPGVDVFTIAIGPLNNPNRFWTLLSYLRLAISVRHTVRSWTPDVVNPHFVTTNGTLARLAGVHPIVLTAWGSDVIPADGRRFGAVARWLNRWAISGADRVTSASRFLAGWVDRASPGAVIDIVPFGVDTTRFRPVGEQTGRGGPVLGVVKSLEPRYGIDTVIDAMAEIANTLPDARLVIAGGGTSDRRLKEQTHRLGLDDRVAFLGRVAHDDVPGLMRTFDILINPTVVPESFGVVILEGSASGLPVIATAVGGVPDVCLDNETGLLVPAGDPGALASAAVRLATDERLRRAMGKTGRDFVTEHFEWSSSVSTMLGILESASGRP